MTNTNESEIFKKITDVPKGTVSESNVSLKIPEKSKEYKSLSPYRNDKGTSKQNEKKSKNRIVSDTDSFIDGISVQLRMLDTKNNKRNYIYKRARFDIIAAFDYYSGYKGLGKTKISQGTLRYGAYLALDYAEKAGLGKYIELLDLFTMSSQGMKYCEQCCVNSNPSIAEMDGHSKIIIPILDEEGLHDGYSNKPTKNLVYKVSMTIGSDLNYTAYLCLVLAIINSKSLCERFLGMVSLKDTYLTSNKISHAFKSKKEAYKRWFFGYGETLYNIYIYGHTVMKIKPII